MRDDDKENEINKSVLGDHGLGCPGIVSNGALSTRVQIQFHWMPINVQKLSSFIILREARHDKAVDEMIQSTVLDTQRSCFCELETGQTFEIDVSKNGTTLK